LGGVGARKWGLLHLGNAQGAERALHALVLSEGQREDGGLEVGCLGGCQSKGKEWGLGCTRGAARWGCRHGGMLVLAW
jgi:hypothetical protein